MIGKSEGQIQHGSPQNIEAKYTLPAMNGVAYTNTPREPAVWNALHTMSTNFDRADLVSLGIDTEHSWIGDAYVGMPIEHIDAALDRCWRVEIVVHQPHEILTACLSDEEVMIRGSTKVFGLAQVSDPWINASIFFTDRLGVVRRTVVADKKLVVGIGLIQNRGYGQTKIVPAVVDWQGHREPRGDHGLVAQIIRVVAALKDLAPRGIQWAPMC